MIRMSRTVLDDILDAIGSVLNDRRFWIGVGIGALGMVALALLTGASSAPKPSERYLPPGSRISRRLPDGTTEVVEGPVWEWDSLRNLR